MTDNVATTDLRKHLQTNGVHFLWDSVQNFIKLEADVNVRCSDGQTIFHLLLKKLTRRPALHDEIRKQLEWLFVFKPNLNQPSSDGKRPLDILYEVFRDFDIFQKKQILNIAIALIKAGANPNTYHDGNFLHLAIHSTVDEQLVSQKVNNTYSSIVTYLCHLIKLGVNPKQLDKWQHPPLYYYLRSNINRYPLDDSHWTGIKMLFLAGANPNICNERKNSILHIAIQNNWQPNSLLDLINYSGIDVTLRNEDNNTAMDLYTQQQNPSEPVMKALTSAAQKPYLERKSEIAQHVFFCLTTELSAEWEIKQFADHKEAVLAYINAMGDRSEKIKWIKTALYNPQSPLWHFFRIQRGFFSTVEGRGSLAQLAEMLQKLEGNVDEDSLPCSALQGLWKRFSFFITGKNDQKPVEMLSPSDHHII